MKFRAVPGDVTVSVRVAEHDDGGHVGKGNEAGIEKQGGGGKDREKGKGNNNNNNKRKVETADDIYAQEIGNKSVKRGKKGGGAGGKRHSGGR